ncbi:TrmB family transcriptional regulator [Candidatus Woesearchaeota archaeon]|nr:TrmB family transcriptional regulator [Candidatus Woesearchaeota archaeon]
MIVKDEFLNKLRRSFSLNLYEVKIWTALLSRGVSTAGELSDIGNVPRSRAYDVLESLEKKGFAVMKLGKPIKYVAVDPREVVERVKKLVRVEADEGIKRLDDLNGTDVLNELESLHREGVEFIEPTDLSGAIRGRHNLYTHLELMIKGAQKSVTLMTTSKGLLRKYDALKPELEKLSKRGVKIRVAAPLTKEASGVVKDLSKVAEVRHVDKINARFCIVDGKELTFMVLDDNEVHPTYDFGIWINTPYFASALDQMFDLAWKDMQPPTKANV